MTGNGHVNSSSDKRQSLLTTTNCVCIPSLQSSALALSDAVSSDLHFSKGPFSAADPATLTPFPEVNGFVSSGTGFPERKSRSGKCSFGGGAVGLSESESELELDIADAG